MMFSAMSFLLCPEWPLSYLTPAYKLSSINYKASKSKEETPSIPVVQPVKTPEPKVKVVKEEPLVSKTKEVAADNWKNAENSASKAEFDAKIKNLREAAEKKINEL